jgi:hypothetical protein
MDAGAILLLVVITAIAIPLVVLLGKAWGFWVGGRRFDSVDDFVARTSEMTGLQGTAPSGFFSGFADTRFAGTLPSGRPASIHYVAHTTSTGKGTTTYYTVHFAVAIDPAVRLKVTREGILSKLGSWLGLVSDVKVGDQGFDARFWIKAPDEARTRRAFDRGLKHGVERLFESYGVADLEAGAGWLQTQAREGSIDPYFYSTVLHELDEGARSFDRASIEVTVLGGKRRALRDANGATRCAYCHDEISGRELDLVACEQCKTVLHDECWHELGHCPLMGCAGRTAERPRASVR